MKTLDQEIYDIGDRIFAVTGIGTIDDPLYVAMLGVQKVEIFYNAAGHNEIIVQYVTEKGTHRDVNVYSNPDDAEHGKNTFGLRSIGDRGDIYLAYYSSVMGYTTAVTGWDTPPGPEWITTGK
jgi:hypothetical protein